VIRDKSHCII